MEYLTMAQACGEEPIRDQGMTPSEVDEYFGGDMEAANEHFKHDREDKIAALETMLNRYRELYGDL